MLHLYSKEGLGVWLCGRTTPDKADQTKWQLEMWCKTPKSESEKNANKKKSKTKLKCGNCDVPMIQLFSKEGPSIWLCGHVQPDAVNKDKTVLFIYCKTVPQTTQKA